MEDTHGDTSTNGSKIVYAEVLILIIMEDTHGGFADGTKALLSES